MYAEGANKAKRKKVSLFWEHANLYAGYVTAFFVLAMQFFQQDPALCDSLNNCRLQNSAGKDGMRRLKRIVHMGDNHDHKDYNHADEQQYGIGAVREPENFFETFGIHVDSETTENHLCSFVQGGKMHLDFTEHLRPDGMGIDYDKIHYVFKDPHPGQQ